eukprot:9130684-Pyramimonas_sp.AAC.1
MPAPEAALYDASAVELSPGTGAATLATATCPACHQRHQKRKVTTDHNHEWGKCILAVRPPMPVAAVLEEVLPLEAPEEDAKPEEKPAPALVRAEELIDQLDVEPVVEPIFGNAAAAAASGCTINTSPIIDVGTGT